MSLVTSLDHVGVVGRDLGTLAAGFEAIGFNLTPFARQAGGRVGSRCIMLQQGYIELVAKVAGATSATLDRFLARRSGAHIVALGINDPAAVLGRLRRLINAVPDPVESERPIDDADPDSERARFVVITPPDQPEGRYNLVRHLTPEMLWQERFLQHPNQAVALSEIILRSPDPAATAAGIGVLTGRPFTPDPAGGYALALPQGRLRVWPDDHKAQAAWIAGLTIQTADQNAALLEILNGQGTAWRRDADAVVFDMDGVMLRFVNG